MRTREDNFTLYKASDIIDFLLNEYKINAKNIKVFNNAMDNTVIDIDDQYILKIYETKTVEFISESLNLYNKALDFYCIDLIKNKDGGVLNFFQMKPMIIYKKVSGSFSNDLDATIQHIAKFHQNKFVDFRKLDFEHIFDEIRKKIAFYFPPYLAE